MWLQGIEVYNATQYIIEFVVYLCYVENILDSTAPETWIHYRGDTGYLQHQYTNTFLLTSPSHIPASLKNHEKYH